jgi:hypothetical protein
MTTDGMRGEIMALTMDSTSPVAEHVAPQPDEAWSPPPEITALSSGRASIYVPRKRRLWTATLAAALLVTAGGLGILYVDDTNYQNADRALTIQNESLTGRNQNLQTALTTTQAKLTASQSQVSSLAAQLEHPTLGIWNVPEAITGSSYYLAAGVPDTFTYHLKLTSNGPMSVSILSIHQFGDAVRCVETGVGTTNYCMHHSGSAWGQLNTTSVNFDFHLAEGCAAYLAVITSTGSITVTPDVSVTYNPASAATGACA